MAKARENYVKDLNEMYDSFYKNDCNYNICSNCMCESPANIKFDYAAKIGEDYGKVGAYKVLVVGKESKYQRATVEKTVYDISKAPNTHYRGTLYTLTLLLTNEVPESTSVNDLKKHNDLLKQFCLTNYFKCAFREYDKDKKGQITVRGLPVNQFMVDACCKLLLQEIEILEPDIVIMQGKFTSKLLWDALEKEGYRCKYGENTPISLYRYTLNGRSFYVLWSYHPTSPQWGKYKQQLIEAISVFKSCHK